MRTARKAQNILRGLLQAHGTRPVKSYLWNLEFSRGRWDCLDSTQGDCVYPYIEKYANKGSILDLGCGSGSTANELAATAYSRFTGVDVSDVAIEKARKRTDENGRAHEHRYIQSDIFSYVPAEKFDVILFRDSIYYVPHGRIRQMLNRYTNHLKETGVFIVRMSNGGDKYRAIADTIEKNFAVVDKHVSHEPNAVVLVFRQADQS